MTDINQYLSVITLNENGLNSPIKRWRLAEWIKTNKQTNKQKTRPNNMLPNKKCTTPVKTHRD
jgi:hypothetical protein